MAPRPDRHTDPHFETLCELLRIPSARRTLADCLRIGRLVDRLRPPDTRVPGGTRRPYRAGWMPALVERLTDRGVPVSDTLLYRWARFARCRDRHFLAACKKCRHARWEEVMRLLPVADPALRLELLDVADRAGAGALSSGAFRDLVRVRVTGPAGRRRLTPGRRAAYAIAVRGLRGAAERASREGARWLDGEAALARGLAAEVGLDPADTGRVRAAVRRFRAAARALGDALGPVDAAVAGRRPHG
jgi:hypothetical protein